MLKVIGIYRENALAGKASSDRNILELTAEYLKKNNCEVILKDSKNITEEDNADIFFSMARGSQVNQILSKKDSVFFNNPKAIMKSLNRGEVYQKMIEKGANIPETKFVKVDELSFSDFNKKYILKPANRHEFWFEVGTEEEFNNAISEYKKNSIEDIIMQEFVEGEHVKFYGIGEEIFLPEKASDFSEEVLEDIKRQVSLTREIAGLDIFGGDFIIGKKPYCVDLNDWPSFGSVEGHTQEEMAPKIGEFILKEYNNKK